jgi:hypothetical protein
MDTIIAMFLIATSAFVSVFSAVAMADGVSGMGIVAVGCFACFIGGWILLAKELS